MTDNEKVQKLTLSLLKVFMEICEEHDLRWYFTGGALIGVMRHKGFVPWDDDIDIAMPRRDYEIFQDLIMHHAPEGYGICNRYTDPNWHFLMSQFIDLESEIEIQLAEEPRKAHIWLDIFPMDGLPSAPGPRWLREKNILMHRYLVQLANITTQVDVNRQRPGYEKAILAFCKVIPVGKLLNTDRILDDLERVLVKNDFYESRWTGNLLGRYREKEVVPKRWFGTPKKAIFEGIEVNVPANAHKIQTQLYGDYMQLPPEEQRIAHNVTILRSRELS